MDIILGAALGGWLAFLLALPAVAIEIGEGQRRDLPLLVDVKEIWGVKITGRAVFLLALFNHIVIGLLFGLFYPLLTQVGWFDLISDRPYSFFSLLIYALLFWLVLVAVVFPSMGFGFLGRREGRVVWLEVLLTVLLIAVLWRLVIEWWQPFFFYQ